MKNILIAAAFAALPVFAQQAPPLPAPAAAPAPAPQAVPAVKVTPAMPCPHQATDPFDKGFQLGYDKGYAAGMRAAQKGCPKPPCAKPGMPMPKMGGKPGCAPKPPCPGCGCSGKHIVKPICPQPCGKPACGPKPPCPGKPEAKPGCPMPKIGDKPACQFSAKLIINGKEIPLDAVGPKPTPNSIVSPEAIKEMEAALKAGEQPVIIRKSIIIGQTAPVAPGPKPEEAPAPAPAPEPAPEPAPAPAPEAPAPAPQA